MKTLFIAGDSTAAQKSVTKRPESGWGEFLQENMHPTITVENRALNGRSTRSFLHEGHFDAILKDAHPNDGLIIQFGHNDGKVTDPTRYSDPNTSYPDHLETMIKRAQNQNIEVLLLTSICRATLHVHSDLSAYQKSMLELAEKLDVTIIDMYALTEHHFNHIGPEATHALFLHLKPGMSENYPEGIIDNTHLNLNGASQICSLFVKALRLSNSPLKSHLKEVENELT